MKELVPNGTGSFFFLHTSVRPVPPDRAPPPAILEPMHFDAHQPIINDLEARILTIRDSL
jgi:hypothetical protein